MPGPYDRAVPRIDELPPLKNLTPVPSIDDVLTWNESEIKLMYQRLDNVMIGRKAADEKATPESAIKAVENAVQGVTPLHKSASGATSSHVPLRFDLVPRQLLECVARTYTEGAKIHTERGYQKGLGDRDFIVNRINHIFEHINKLFHPNSSNIGTDEGCSPQSFKENVGAILWGLAFLLEVLDHSDGTIHLADLIRSGRVKYKSGM